MMTYDWFIVWAFVAGYVYGAAMIGVLVWLR
jgi:hypothetical protein